MPYGTRAMASPPITTAEVGMKRFMIPEALWNAVTTSSAGTSAKSASGLMIGIATVARPDEDGIRNDSGRNSSEHHDREAGLADVAERLLGPVAGRCR